MKSCHHILKNTFGVYMFSLLLFDFIKNQFWTVEWTLLLNEEDGGSYFAFGFGKRFYLFVICCDFNSFANVLNNCIFSYFTALC